MDYKRKRDRIVVDISVTLTTVLDSVEARVIDLSENGAQIMGASMPMGAKFQIEYRGQTVYAQCMWSEIDRMGVRFPFAMTDGPLHDILQMAMPAERGYGPDDTMDGTGGGSGFMPPSQSHGAAARRPSAPSFGRRSAS